MLQKTLSATGINYSGAQISVNVVWKIYDCILETNLYQTLDIPVHGVYTFSK